MSKSSLFSQMPSFNGSSHLTYFGLGDDSPLMSDIEVVIRPDSSVISPGIILYNGARNDGEGDFIAIYIADDGTVAFAFDNGDGATTVR